MSESDIFDLYRSMNLWKNPICKHCKATASPPLSGPVAIWQVGQHFEADQYRLIFVGKNARGSIHDDDDVSEELARNGFIDGTREADKWINETWGAYWYYTAAIIEQLFGSLEKGWDRVAFANLVKCNNSMGADGTSPETKLNCLDKLGVTWRELDLLKPRNILLFSAHSYDDFIARYASKFECHEETSKDCQVTNGGKMMLWWELHCTDRSGYKFRLLRTSHPERQKKNSFVDRLVRWLKSS